MTTTTFTSGLRLTSQPTGGNANTWGTITDDNMEFLDDALTGIVSVDLTGASSQTLTVNNGADDEARNASLVIHGVPSSANSVIIPAAQKNYAIRTTHTSVAGGITIRTATGTGVNLLTGRSGFVQCDGVSVFDLDPPVSALDPSNNLSDLGDAVAAVSNLGLAYLGSANALDSTMQTSAGKLGVNVSSIFEVIYPVGSLYSNRTDGTNPGTLIGFGTWTSAGIGRVLIGVGTGIDSNGVSAIISAETCSGEYEHVMTTAELVSHTHVLWQDDNGTAGGNTVGRVGPTEPAGGVQVDPASTGSSEAFNVQQPWYSVFHWVRDS